MFGGGPLFGVGVPVYPMCHQRPEIDSGMKYATRPFGCDVHDDESTMRSPTCACVRGNSMPSFAEAVDAATSATVEAVANATRKTAAIARTTRQWYRAQALSSV